MANYKSFQVYISYYYFYLFLNQIFPAPEVTALSETVSTPVRSLFSAEGLSPSPSRACMSARRPSFNASTFGSPGFVDRTLSTCRAINSPFYSGRTMYGGAAAYQRSRLAIQQNKPSIQVGTY